MAESREPRLGDIVDDYCSHCQLIMNHGVVGIVAGQVKRTRCNTCLSEHPYRRAKIPPQKKDKVKVSGVLQTHFLHRFDSNDDGEVRANRFRVQRPRISFKGKVNRHVSYDVMIDPRSPDISGVLRDAFSM